VNLHWQYFIGQVFAIVVITADLRTVTIENTNVGGTLIVNVYQYLARNIVAIGATGYCAYKEK
jgi:hypothetical protein